MTQQVFQTGEMPELIVEQVGGDLRVQSWSERAVTVTGDVTLEASQSEQIVRIRCEGDCTIQAPRQALLRVESVGGDGRVLNMLSQVVLNRVGGDLLLEHTGPVAVENVGGDLRANHVFGDLSVARVGGDASIHEVKGNCRVEQVGDDLVISNVAGAIDGQVGDSVSLRLMARGQHPCRLRAGGNVVCRVPQNGDLTVSLVCGGQIKVRNLTVADGAGRGRMEFVLGTGAAPLNLTAGGSISLTGQGETEWGEDGANATDWGAEFGQMFGLRASELAEQVASQVEIQVESIARQLDEKLAELGGSEEIAARVQQKVQAAMSHAERKIAEAMRKVEQRMQESDRRAQRTAERRGHGASAWAAASPPRPPKAPEPRKRNVATEQERTMILRMVEEGKLSVDQAEQLLRALSAQQ